MGRYKNKNLPKKPNNKKGIAFWVVFFFMCFWTICSALSIYNFVDYRQKTPLIACADELTASGAYYRYDSPNIFVPSNRVIKADIPNVTYSSLGASSFPMSFSYIVEWLTTNPYLDISFSVASGTSYYLSSISKTDNTWVNHGLVIRFNPSVDNNKTYYFALNEDADYVYGTMTLSADLNFNLGSVFSYSYDSTITTVNDLHKVTNYIILNDSADLEFRFGIVWYTRSANNGQAWANKYSWTPRTILLNNNFSDDLAFELGREQGYQEGKRDYENSGFQDGFDRGKEVGKDEGYIEGVEDANTYSFLGLFSALVDVPVRAVSSLFDFTILGFNFKQLVFSLFTLCVIILIIRLIVGGGKNE